jgi:hypothetical protein
VEAQLALEKFKAPRKLTPEQQSQVVTKIKFFSATPFEMTLFDDPEAIDLVLQIEDVLNSAGWTEQSWSGAGSINFTRPQKPTVGLNSMTGLFVQADASRASDLGAAAVALASALKDAGLAATSQVGQMPEGMNKSAVQIQIGKKPL